MLDMILIEKRWSSSVCGCRSFPGPEISSDHNLVLSSFQSKFKILPATKMSRQRYNINKLTSNETKEFQRKLKPKC